MESEIRIKLLQEEAKLVKEGLSPFHAVTPINFVIFGLRLEDEQ